MIDDIGWVLTWADAAQPTFELLEVKARLQSAPGVKVTGWSQAGMPGSPAVA